MGFEVDLPSETYNLPVDGHVIPREPCESHPIGRVRGAATPALNTRVPYLTTLSKRHGRKFPFEYLESVLRFGEFNTGIVIVVQHGEKPSPELIERAEAIRKQWIGYFSITTAHRASMTANPR